MGLIWAFSYFLKVHREVTTWPLEFLFLTPPISEQFDLGFEMASCKLSAQRERELLRLRYKFYSAASIYSTSKRVGVKIVQT